MPGATCLLLVSVEGSLRFPLPLVYNMLLKASNIDHPHVTDLLLYLPGVTFYFLPQPNTLLGVYIIMQAGNTQEPTITPSVCFSCIKFRSLCIEFSAVLGGEEEKEKGGDSERRQARVHTIYETKLLNWLCPGRVNKFMESQLGEMGF